MTVFGWKPVDVYMMPLTLYWTQGPSPALVDGQNGTLQSASCDAPIDTVRRDLPFDIEYATMVTSHSFKEAFLRPGATNRGSNFSTCSTRRCLAPTGRLYGSIHSVRRLPT